MWKVRGSTASRHFLGSGAGPSTPDTVPTTVPVMGLLDADVNVPDWTDLEPLSPSPPFASAWDTAPSMPVKIGLWNCLLPRVCVLSQTQAH
jgi:hypothetical protein